MLTTADGIEIWEGDIADWAARALGVHPKTVARWRRRRAWPRAVVRLAALELEGHLGMIHPRWRRWRLDRRTGALLVPPDLIDVPPVTQSFLLSLLMRHEVVTRPVRAPRRANGWIWD